MDYIKKTSRLKAVFQSSLIILFAIGGLVLKFFLSPNEYNGGNENQRHYFSFNFLIFIIIVSLIVLIIIFLFSRIPSKIILDEHNKTLKIEFIKNFRVKSKTYVINLSDVQFSKQEFEYYRNMKKQIETTYSITSEKIGTLQINDSKLIDYFEGLKLQTVQVLRTKRLAKKALLKKRKIK